MVELKLRDKIHHRVQSSSGRPEISSLNMLNTTVQELWWEGECGVEKRLVITNRSPPVHQQQATEFKINRAFSLQQAWTLLIGLEVR